MRLTATAQISLDGVIEGPGRPHENQRDGVERGGWAHFDDEAGAAMDDTYGRADAFLFGRRTYEMFAATWATWDDPGDSQIWTALHTKPKFVASTTLAQPAWADTTVISGDFAAAIGELRAKPGRELQVHGSGALVRWLFENDLVDALNLFTFPVIVGQGDRLFAERGRAAELELIDTRVTATGITIQTYQPARKPH